MFLSDEQFADWISLNVTAPASMTDRNYMGSHVQVLFGTPPQPINLAISLSEGDISVSSPGCAYCPGPDRFDQNLSATSSKVCHQVSGVCSQLECSLILFYIQQPGNRSSTEDIHKSSVLGSYVTDVVSFGTVLTHKNLSFCK